MKARTRTVTSLEWDYRDLSHLTHGKPEVVLLQQGLFEWRCEVNTILIRSYNCHPGGRIWITVLPMFSEKRLTHEFFEQRMRKLIYSLIEEGKLMHTGVVHNHEDERLWTACLGFDGVRGQHFCDTAMEHFIEIWKALSISRKHLWYPRISQEKFSPHPKHPEVMQSFGELMARKHGIWKTNLDE
jgi:hypothetical protein